MKKTLLLFIFLLQFITVASFADEGMWLPIFLKQLNESDMQSKGMKVSAEDIYSVNKSSMKDAVVLFGAGCTGALISDQGLLLTNHHCGFSQIQSHSTLENNYIKNGFWAYNQQQEIPCAGLTVTFIIRMEDVTSQIVGELTEDLSEQNRELKIKGISADIEKKAIEGTHYNASVKSFYNGNQFFLFVMETFKDIRMVGAPPNSIGDFGGDTDNWMWPRHTGDFTIFRVYANKDNKPAEFSTSNVPFTPRYFFPVSLNGIQPGDFTMVYGFPGRTTQYLPSAAVKNIVEVTNPTRIKIRDARLKIMENAMSSSEKLRIQYAAKRRSLANGWKKWQGEMKGLERMNTIAIKKQEEIAFKKWFNENNKSEYATLLPDFDIAYSSIAPMQKTTDYINEAAYGVELLRYAKGFSKLAELSSGAQADEAAAKAEAERILKGRDGFFRDFDSFTDQLLFASMMNMYYKDIDASLHPQELSDIYSKYNGDFSKYAALLYSKSIFSDSTRLKLFLTDFSIKKIKQLLNDPAYKLADGFVKIYETKIEAELNRLTGILAKLNRKYMAAQMEMQTSKKFYPDANSTLRVAYGQIASYEPRDGVRYSSATTLNGILEKEDASVDEFEVPVKLKELIEKKDFGQYEVSGTVPVAFIASNHTTGGNSGSPVLNKNGELIGINFDRVWEGTMSDIDFDPEQCRNITLDVRYILFIVDKYAGCRRLVDEMKLVK